MDRLNPFSRQESRTRSELATYRVLTLASWALSVAVSVYYSVRSPHGWGHNAHRIARQNHLHPSAFSLNMVIVYVYFVSLFVSQAGYLGHLFASAHQSERVNAAVAVGSHFIVNNVFHAVFVLLFVSGHFFWAEVVLLLNFVNLTSLYFRHPSASHPRGLVHTPTVAGPLAWTFVAIYWNGAIMVPHAHSLAMRILANVFVWAILAYGLFYIMVYADYSMGFALSVLAAALGAGQFLRQFIALQWIFAFIVMSVLFLATVAVALPVWTGRQQSVLVIPRDSERAPLLDEQQ
ncbi:hypothetical protein SPBR_07704 [Sporothrix brasiliensis 5110]|uniref:ATP synthase F0 n=1 Tax=Sporothrix brasiliensis 5110 TaxID=1398154 RepID=A0A0C2IPL5_9PEZI|nr:uncharacterized protein SPBR_07704 [Sporothrix brasiliensis 5110]KIH88870.1 hypothetical protein SPBR_07704 [Sporothrix brasiliensis 5110]